MNPQGSSDAISVCRDHELGGVCLAKARCSAWPFERHLHDELVVVVPESGAGTCITRGGGDRVVPGSVRVFAPGDHHEGHVEHDTHWFYRAFHLDEAAVGCLDDVLPQNGPGFGSPTVGSRSAALPAVAARS